tara:strand:- start:156092 stop:156790 length:699 start_codon:yes stop_codon:yes gene_type:complete
MADQLKEITLVCVDTRDDHRLNAAKTLIHCQTVFPCREAILFTDKLLDTKGLAGAEKLTVVGNIRSVNENRSYDYFMLSQLPSYITTPHYLIVQTDGFILNPLAWSDEFLKYHYIGAPWGHHPMHYWPPHQPVGPNTSVGNGGFCLRSRLLGMTAQGIFHSMSRQPGFVTEHWYPEDCFIARDIRPMLEDKGFKFAPEDLAAKFSCENKIYTDQFGFHGSETLRMNPNIKLL